jgi:glycosyltransferase involved in cell wall biosynthesis
MKIAIVTPVYTKESTWGPVTVIRNVMRILKYKGYDFVVYACKATSPNKLSELPSMERIEGIPVKRYKVFFHIGGYYITPTMFLDLMKDDFDIIHAHCARSFQLDLAALVSKLRKKPLIVSAHGTLASYIKEMSPNPILRYLNMLYNPILRISLNQATICTALSELEENQYNHIFKVPQNKIKIIPNGIDPSLYLKPATKGIFKEKYGIKDSQIILYLGRINKVKGIEFLIRSFAFLVNNLKYNKAVLVLAGPDDGYLQQARYLSRSFRIEEKVFFTGFLSEFDKVCAYTDSTVVVHPEAFNVTLIAPLEAAAAGKTIILARGNYLSKVAEEMGFGFSVRYGDIESMARLLHKVLSDHSVTMEMGEKGREFVLKNLSWTNIAEEYENIYLKALKSG